MADARRHHPAIGATEVPCWSEIERMSVRRAALPAFAPHSPGARVYVALWQEIRARLPRR